MSGVEGFKVKGFYRLKLVDKDGNVVSTEHHNFVSNNIKKLALAESMSRLFRPNTGNPFGHLYCPDNGEFRFINHSSYFSSFNEFNNSKALVLLNLDDNIDMNATTQLLDIYAKDGSGIDENKVTGYSMGRPTSNIAKEGVIKDITSADLMNPQCQVVNTYEFDLDKANGDFNWLAIMPAFKASSYRSLMTFKCISSYNIRKQGHNYNKGYIGPGVKDSKGNVLTGDNQILTFETDGSTSRWYYDIITGEKRPLQPEEFGYNYDISSSSLNNNIGSRQLVIGDYLYFVTGTYLYKVEIATGKVASTGYLNYNNPSTACPCGLYYDGEKIIVSTFILETTASYSSRPRVYEFNPDTLNQITSVTNEAYQGWDNLPVEWLKQQTCFTKIKDYYIVSNYASKVAIICTDIMNVCGSIVGIAPSRIMSTYEIGESIWCITPIDVEESMYLSGDSSGIIGGYFRPSGIYISDFVFSNFWSAAKLDKKYTKTSAVKAIIDYGYTFE